VSVVVNVCHDDRKYCFLRPDDCVAETNKHPADVMCHCIGFADYGDTMDDRGPISATFEALSRGYRCAVRCA
jgi:hypothetical protein